MAFNPAADLADLKGKVAIVTGGNTGIGFATVQHLVRAGAKVYLAARNESRANGALAKLEAEGLKGEGKGEVVWLKLDLDDPRNAKKAAEEFLRREKRLDILVNNAGNANIFAPCEIGPDGISKLSIVNYICPFLFTKSLLPLMKDTAKESGSDVRIVNVASGMHKWMPDSPKFDKVEDFNASYKEKLFSGTMRYAHSKFMMVSWTKTLQAHLNDDPSAPITVISLHPGAVDSYSSNWYLPWLWRPLMSLFMVTPEFGAYTSVFAAAGKTVKEQRALYQGAYLKEKPTGCIEEPHKDALSTEIGEQLWDTTESFLASLAL